MSQLTVAQSVLRSSRAGLAAAGSRTSWPAVRRCLATAAAGSGSSSSSSGSAAGSLALLTIPVLTFGLGTWQVFRKQQKEELIAHMQAKLSQPPKPLPASPADIRGMEYERVVVEGEFLHDQEMLVHPRTKLREMFAGMSDRPEPGAHVITPFRRADTGAVILVNRGFVPDSQRDPTARNAGQVSGRQTIEGIVRFGEKPNNFTPSNRPERNTWHWVDLITMAEYRDTQPILIDAVAESTPPGGYPVGGQTRLTIRNEHLQYILTWYSLSFITFAMWLKFRKGGGSRRPATLRRAPPA